MVQEPIGEREWASFLEATFLSVLETTDDGIMVFDPEGTCRMLGRKVGELFGVEPVSLVGHPRPLVLRSLAQAAEDPDAFFSAVAVHDLLDPPRVIGELELLSPKPRVVRMTSVPVVRDGSPFGRVILVRDITRERSAERAQKQLQARLAEFVTVDPLTGLVNARRFRDDLEREHSRSVRAWDSFATLVLDVDGMGLLNDECGTVVGDAVLEELSTIVKRSRRDYDVAARMPGDEIAVLLPGADAVSARTVADRIRALIADTNFGLPERRRVSVSAGAAVWVPPSVEKGPSVLERALCALARAKERSVDRVFVDDGSSIDLSHED